MFSRRRGLGSFIPPVPRGRYVTSANLDNCQTVGRHDGKKDWRQEESGYTERKERLGLAGTTRSEDQQTAGPRLSSFLCQVETCPFSRGAVIRATVSRGMFKGQEKNITRRDTRRDRGCQAPRSQIRPSSREVTTST